MGLRRILRFVVVLAAVGMSMGFKCGSDDDPKDNPDGSIAGSKWRVEIGHFVQLIAFDKDDGYDLPRRFQSQGDWNFVFRVEEDGELRTVSASYDFQYQEMPTAGWLDPGYTYRECGGCIGGGSSQSLAFLAPGGTNGIYRANPPYPPGHLDFTPNKEVGSFFIGAQYHTDDLAGCSPHCTGIDYFDFDPPIQFHYREAPPRDGITTAFVMFNATAVDQVQFADFDNGKLKIKIRCLENCQNVDCSEGCDDDQLCTEDRCVIGRGCVFEPVEPMHGIPWPCDDHICGTGICVDGECVLTEPGCPDDEICMTYECHPDYGCLPTPLTHVISNESPHDCKQEICVNGEYHEDAPAFETPIQNSTNDCLREVCIGNEIDTFEDNSEPGCP